MNVILDTNIFVQDFLMNSRSFCLLLDYLKKTGSKILMPSIVYQELGEIYRSELGTRSAQFERARESLEKALIDATIPRLETDVSSEVAKYLAFVRKKLNLHDKDIIPFRENYLGELVARAITRVKPFSDKGEEFRDALLWLTVLDIAREANEETLAFISNDAKAFGQNHQLHEALYLEGKATGKQVNYYNSISKFIESHGTQVDFITQSWLFNAINYGTFEDAVTRKLTEYLEDLNEYDLRQRGWEGLEFTGYLSSTSSITEDNLTEYYVYEKADGSLYVQANYYIEYEVEFTFRERVRENRFRQHSWQTYDYDRDYDDEYTIETKIVYKCREAEIIFGVAVKDKQVIEVELSSVYL
jgi:predicted nucleic acid-binding protein